MPVPVQEVVSGLEQVEVPEPALQDALEQEEMGVLAARQPVPQRG